MTRVIVREAPRSKKAAAIIGFFNYLFFSYMYKCTDFTPPDKSDDYLNRVRTWQTMKRQSLTLFCSNTNVFNCNGTNPRRLFSDSNNKNLQIEGMIKHIKPATARKA